MLLEKLSELLKKKRWILITFIIMCIVLSVLYLIVFFQHGIKFEDEFLIKHKREGLVLYKADSVWGEMKIFRIGKQDTDQTAEIIYEMPGDIYRYYKVIFANPKNWREGITEIHNQNGEVLFKGTSRYSYPHLFDEDGKPVNDYRAGSRIVSSVGIKSPFTNSFFVNLSQVANLASGYRDNVRGNFKLLFLAFMMMMITIIDFSAPRLFFDLRHFLWTNNAEPSDWYLAVQRFGWNVFPILSIVLLLVALIP